MKLKTIEEHYNENSKEVYMYTHTRWDMLIVLLLFKALALSRFSILASLDTKGSTSGGIRFLVNLAHTPQLR